MSKYLILFFFLVTTINSRAQFLGGNRDGYAMEHFGPVLANDQTFYCSGGNRDGYDAESFLAGTMNDQSAYCSGGDGDGYGKSTFFLGRFYQQSVYCSGGNRDGYGRGDTLYGTFNVQLNYCSGGNADGFARAYLSQAPFYDQAPYCSGGNRDGYAMVSLPLDSLGNGIWTGTVSTDWNTPGNWANHVVPTVSDAVHIPTGCVYYPMLTAGLSINNTNLAHHCRSLEIAEGAQISSSNAALSVYGRMVVSGDYTATNNTNLAQNIFSGGSLQILDDGIVRFGNQSTGSGLSDLTVLAGGTLEISGGVLEIDDQLNIAGTFNMSSGYVFTHKYGAGSPVTAISGPFVVSPGASGNVSGGIIRVCGKDGGSQAAIALNDTDFSFTGPSALMVSNGISALRSDVALKTAGGLQLRNLVISKPGFTVTLASDLLISGQLSVLQGAGFFVPAGYELSVGSNNAQP